MTNFSVTDPDSTIHLIKILVSAVGAVLIVTGCSACGLSTGGGFVVGTTSFLQEANRGARAVQPRRETLNDSDRAELAGLIERRVGGR